MNAKKKKKYTQPKIKTETLKTELFNLRSLRDEIGEFNLLAATEADSDCGGCSGCGCGCGCGSTGE